MDDQDERHGEIMGSLGRIEQKADHAHEVLHRHETVIETVTEDIGELRDSVSKGKGIAIAAVTGATILAAIGGIVAKAKEIF